MLAISKKKSLRQPPVPTKKKKEKRCFVRLAVMSVPSETILKMLNWSA